MNSTERTWQTQQNKAYLFWQPDNKEINIGWQPIRSPICQPVLLWMDHLSSVEGTVWWGTHPREDEKRHRRKNGLGSHMATLRYLIGGGTLAARKCNSERLSEYDISGSFSICSQSLKWRRAWHGGREVRTASLVPVSLSTLSVGRNI